MSNCLNSGLSTTIIRLLCVLIVPLPFALTTVGVPFVAHCDENCDNEHQESGQGCDDCVCCFAFTKKFTINENYQPAVFTPVTGTVYISSLDMSSAPVDEIEHPPQNLL